jgi:hypothetical protein
MFWFSIQWGGGGGGKSKKEFCFEFTKIKKRHTPKKKTRFQKKPKI